LSYFVEILEKLLGKAAIKEYLPIQPGDVHQTYADIDELIEDFDFRPQTGLFEGLGRFVEWYRGFY
jgi:UDP-glucuronate 4-epimerase